MAEKTKESFKESQLSEQELKDFKFVQTRIQELQTFRTQEHYGVYLEKIWADADRDYTPHRLKSRGRKVLVEDETKGWRGTSSLVELGATDWQSDIAQPNPYVKIQTALAILVDQNPSGVFTAASKKYQATTELIKQLYQRSWDVAKSKQQLKLFVFNLAKYGWATGRTYPLRIARKVKQLKEYNSEEPDKSVYEEKEYVEYNDVMRENLDPRNAWIDDMAKPNNSFSVRDWAWRKIYALDVFKEEFKGWKLSDLVQPGGITTETITATSQPGDKKYQETQLVEVYFYENRLKDLFVVMANNIPVVISPLPISDSKGGKKLSLWQTYWNLRHAESPYGIGMYEAMRFDNALLDRIRNMTIDQLTLSIYKMGFYQGTQALTETGDIKIKPGFLKQTLDPKNINWLEIKGPGAEAWKGLEEFRNDLNESSGITPQLSGIVEGKTAFEIAQAKEAALKRLKIPLENITDALDNEAYITISLIQLLYSIPETYKISDPNLIEAYLNEIQSDPELYERTETTDELGQPQSEFTAKVFPEFPINLEEDEKGNLIETEQTRFFRIKPSGLNWEGIVNVKAQSILTPSKQVDKALDLEMYNMLIPLLSNPPEIYSKVAKALVKLYDKDPRDILPDMWLQDQAQLQQQAIQNQPLIVPSGGNGQGQTPFNSGPQAQKLVSSTQPPVSPQGLVGKIASGFGRLFR